MTRMELVRDTGIGRPWRGSAQADVSYLLGDVRGKSRGRTGALQQWPSGGTSKSSFKAMMRPEASGSATPALCRPRRHSLSGFIEITTDLTNTTTPVVPRRLFERENIHDGTD